MIPHSLHNKEYFLGYDEKYDIFSYYFLCFSAALIAKYLKLITIGYNRFLNLNSSFTYLLGARLWFDLAMNRFVFIGMAGAWNKILKCAPFQRTILHYPHYL